MHGMPPSDFPKSEAAEFFSLHARLHHAAAQAAALERRHAELHAKMRAWPWTADNDPFHAGSLGLAACLSDATGCNVIVGFNEYCAPSLDDALEQAVTQGARTVVVITPMMTQGGEHSEVDIPAAIRRTQERHLQIPILYAWPLEVHEVARFLAAQIDRLVKTTDSPT